MTCMNPRMSLSSGKPYRLRYVEQAQNKTRLIFRDSPRNAFAHHGHGIRACVVHPRVEQREQSPFHRYTIKMTVYDQTFLCLMCMLWPHLSETPDFYQFYHVPRHALCVLQQPGSVDTWHKRRYLETACVLLELC